MISKIIDVFREPSAFPNDPLNWAYSQIGHGYLGVALTTSLVWVLLQVSGEHPDELMIVLLVSVGYLAFWEWDIQGWRGWDSIEDFLFVTAGASLFIIIDMSEVINRLMLWVTLVGIAIIGGVYLRLRNQD